MCPHMPSLRPPACWKSKATEGPACFGNYKLSAQVVEHIWKTLFPTCFPAAASSVLNSHGYCCRQQIGGRLDDDDETNGIGLHR